MDTHEQRVVAFLSRPESYPHPAGKIQTRQTHVSHVFLAGDFAYKLKKPVKFPFLDASTVELRKRYCEFELSLNRRLAPDIYLGMEPIIDDHGALRLGGRVATAPRHSIAASAISGDGNAIDWVVKMRRLPEDRLMDKLVARRRVTQADMRRLADRLMPFFRKAERGSKIDHYGEPAQVRALVLGNLDECRPFVGALLAEKDRVAIDAAYRQYLALHEPVLAERVRKGRIIDGHGDLRCENICLTNPVNVFDCVEFQPAFRCGDIVNDLAFLIMDLEFRDRADLAKVLVQRYRAGMRDSSFDAVLPLYKCHRTLVRGKVRAFAWQQHPDSADGRRARSLSRKHFKLARRYAQALGRPKLIVVGGLIGSGKSTLARGLAETFGAEWLRSDEIRLTEFAHHRGQENGFADGIYSPKVSNQVYARLIRRAQEVVRAGKSVVCDGTFSKHEGRSALRQIARKMGADFHFFECTVPRAVALKRVAARAAAKSDISEARPEHYDRLKAGFEPVRAWSKGDWTRISDDRAPEATLQAALNVLRRCWSAR